MTDNFVNLHLHTEYSLQDSAIKIPQLFYEVEKQGQTAVAITDHGSTAGWYDFQTVAQDSPVKPIFGCEFYCKPTLEKPTNNNRYHLVVLAKNNDGLKKIRNLQILSGQHFYRKPLLPYPILFDDPEDLFISTACSLGTVGQSLDPSNKYYNIDRAESFINKLFDVFGKENVACEFQFHPTFINDKGFHVQNAINENLFNVCENVKPLYMIATCDSHFIGEEGREKRRQLIADLLKKKKEDVEESLISNCLGNSSVVHKFAKQSNFTHLDSVDEMILNTKLISDKLNANLDLNYGKVIPKFNKHRELKSMFMKGRRKQIMR